MKGGHDPVTVAWATGVADRIIRRFTSEREGWTAESECMKHLRLVVLAELMREARDGGRLLR